MQPQVLSLGEEKSKAVAVLVEKSHDHYIDLDTVVDWKKGVDRSKAPKLSDHSWVYGTPRWEKLSAAQRHELMWQENARDVSMFIWLEETLPTLFIGYLHQYQGQIPEPIREYMMIFSKEEIVHTLMFRRYMKAAKLDLFGPPDGLQDLFVGQLPKMHPIAGVLCTYLVENVAEEAAMQGTNSHEVDAVTRKMYKAHHFEEARHIAFGKWVCEAFLEKAPDEVKAKLGLLSRTFMSRLIAQFTFNKEILRHLSFDLGVAETDSEEIERIRRSPNNTRINLERYGEMLEWMKRVGLAPADYEWLG